MSGHIEQTITTLQAKLREQEQEVAESKRMINSLRKLIGQPPLFADDDLRSKVGTSPIRADQFYGKGLSTAIREYLDMRRTGDQGPATVAEIYDALMEGGFAFDTKNEDNAKRALRISLTKNTAIFHKLPDGKRYGLLAWYPEAKAARSRRPENTEASSASEEDNEGATEEAATGPKDSDGAT